MFARNSSPVQNSTIHHSVVCPEIYHSNVLLSIISTILFYILPLVAMLAFDVTLYFKMKWRKSVEVQRSTSVTDTYFMTLKKPTLELPESCMMGGETEANKESLLRNSDMKLINKHLAVAGRGERRHSSLPAISPIIQGRTSSGRRVSMPEGNIGGACRYVGRKWSGCSSAFSINQNQPPNPVANLAPRAHNEDMVQDILVKQDKSTVICLSLMFSAVVICLLPHAAVSTLQARCWCLPETTLTATSWLHQLHHAIIPFLYGLMYVQFSKVIKQWLLLERVHAFKMRDTLILKNLQKNILGEEKAQTKNLNFGSSLSQSGSQGESLSNQVHQNIDNTSL